MVKLRTLNQPLPLAKMAYEVLRDSILNGKLVPGEVYKEMALAKELGISRTPVREALLELASQGLVTVLPRKGVLVNYNTKQDVQEIFELRKAIELAAIEKVAKASPPCNLTEIEEALDKQRKAAKKKDYIAFTKADRTFHATFSELTKNRRFVAIVENIRDLVHLMGTQGLTEEGRAKEVIEEHERVLEAVRQGKPVKALEAMDYHLVRSREAVLRQLSSETEE
jgi:DNA-binding GntR family transcriptional regulator